MVGAGPAGSSAARAAAAAGARVVVLDRAAFPRYKTCGGGLIGPSLAALPGAPPIRASITRVSLSLAGGRRRTRTVDPPCLQMVTRAELDAWLLSEAVAAGAEVRVPCRVVSVSDDVVETDDGPAARIGGRRGGRHLEPAGPRGRRPPVAGGPRPGAGARGRFARGGVGGPGAPGLGTDPGVLRLGVPQGRHPHRGRDRRPGRGRGHPRLPPRLRALGRARRPPRRPRLRPPHSLPHAHLAARPGPGAARRRRRRTARAVDPRGHLVRHAFGCAGRHGRGGGAVGRGRALPRRPVRGAAARDGRRRALPARLRGPAAGVPRADPLDLGGLAAVLPDHPRRHHAGSRRTPLPVRAGLGVLSLGIPPAPPPAA